MARHVFGGSPSDYAMERVGDQLLLRPGATGSIWDAPVGGTQLTDLTDPAGAPIAEVTAAADGSVTFYGPDGVTTCWVDFGYIRRFTLVATDLGAVLTAFVAQGGLPDGWASLDGSGRVPLAQLPTLAADGAPTRTVPGLQADGTTDDGPAIQAALESITGTTPHSCEVVVESPPDGVVYINSTVQISTSRVTLRFGSPVLFGPLGRVRIFGELEETPAINKPRLTADATVGSTSITLDDVTPFSVGSFIVIRGQHDASGGTLQRMYNVVTAISGSTLTLADPLDDTYLVSYPDSDWPGDETRITRATSSMLTASAARGDRTVTIDSTADFTAGDWVQALDDTNTHDSDGSPQTTNYVHREITQVAAVVSGTVLRLTGALHHPYSTTTRGRIAKILPVVQSHITGAVATWAAMSTVNNAFEIQYGVRCTIRDCVAAGGASGSWLNQAFRQAYSWGCAVQDCTAYNPQDTSSGRGYGATLYGATACVVRGLHAVSLRHSVLFFNGAAGNIVTNCLSQDCRISDYDMHGAACIDNLITGCTAVGGDSLPTDQPSGVRKAACKVGNPSHIEGDYFNTFSNITVVNYGYNLGGGSALDVVAKSANTTFRDSRVINAANGVTIVTATDTTLIASNTRVVGVEFEDVPTILNVNGGASNIVQGFAFEDCTLVRPTDTVQVQKAQRVTIRGNRWVDPVLGTTTYAITGSTITGLAIRGNDMSGTGRGVKLGSCTTARVTGNVLHDLTGDGTVYEDQGGNTGALVRGNDLHGYTASWRTSGTGPSTGGIVDVYQPYIPDTPARHGWAEWAYDPIVTGAGTGQATTTGTLYLLKVPARTGGTVSNIIATIGSTAPAGTLTTAQNLAAIFDDTGARIAITGDQTTAWATSGLKTMALTASVTLQAGRDYYIGILSVGSSGTAAVFIRSAGGVTTTPNGGQANAAQRFSVNGTSLTAIPSSLTLSSSSGSGAQPYWAALS
ncbi:right-handed parallel beta-helix repeat-containing protein [Streptomyces sp. NPDC002920]